ncbi:MAG: class I SAM-dependent methyltransferase [Bacilli bacterium]
MDNVLLFSKSLLDKYLTKDCIVVDATCGNGNDTLYLCEKFKFVYGFDIQKKAIENTSKLLENHSNFKLFQTSHENICEYVDSCDGAIFNLGYLPNASHKVITKYDSTIKAVESLLTIIKKGIIVLVVYVAHDEGVEGLHLEKYLNTIDKKYDVIKYQFINRNNAPYVLAINIK